MATKYTELEKKLLRDSGSNDRKVADAALEQVTTALELPLRKGNQPGDIVSDIFEQIEVENGVSTAEFPLHFMAPGDEGDYVAFTVPSYGAIPQKLIQSDYVNVPVVEIAATVDWDNKYARNARWDIVSDAGQNVRNQIVAKTNDLGWHTIIHAGKDRGVVVVDSDAAQGQFTTRIVSVLKTVMRRNGGGNSSSINRSQLTDLFVSPEAMEDMRSWNVDVIDEITRREIFTSQDGVINRIFSVNIRDIDELGEGQTYQNFYETTLAGTMPTTSGHTDTEICVGLDLSKKNSFISPVSEELTLVPDNTRVRQRQSGIMAFRSAGFAVLDQRSVLLGSF